MLYIVALGFLNTKNLRAYTYLTAKKITTTVITVKKALIAHWTPYSTRLGICIAGSIFGTNTRRIKNKFGGFKNLLYFCWLNNKTREKNSRK
jgi:hypothetical protein